MQARILELEQISRKLEPQQELRTALLRKSTDYMEEFLESLSQSNAYFKMDCPKVAALSPGKEGSPELSIALFRYPAQDHNDFNKKLVASLHQDGRCFFSSTYIDGELWIRCAVFSFRTHLEHLREALVMVEENLQGLLLETN